MLSEADALRLAALLPQFLRLLPGASRIAVAGYTHTALGALKAYGAGETLDRLAVATALVFVELEIRKLGRLSGVSEANTAERERLWGEIESITAGM